MAKVRSIIKLSGTLADTTFVDSKAYGAHARAKRGTYTPITLADGMKQSAKAQIEVNQLAKIVFDQVNAFVPGFKNGKFWSRLLSVFRQQYKAGKAYNYQDFNQMEMRLDHPSSRQGSFRLTGINAEVLQLHYQLCKESTYQIRLLRIASDPKLQHLYATEMQSIVVTHSSATNTATVEFSAVPPDAHLLYVLHCDRLIDEQPSDLLKYQGVKFFG
ncbi:MAG: hypothetical protein EOO98_00470 [Pedobacter sp.]|nr:MAG: hypothetical protein EOO98_00470 [Pedobacter sp.]